MTQLRALKSWYSPERGGFVTLEDDVLGIVGQIRQLTDGKVTVELDDHRGVYHFVEHDNGTDRLIFTVDQLDQRALDRLMQADSHTRGYQDPYDAAEREQDVLQSKLDDSYREYVNLAGEELIFHLQREGKAPFMSKPVYITEDLPGADS